MPLDQSELLKDELDQRHQYARHAFDRFLQWAVLLCTLNGVVAGWLAGRIAFHLDLFADIAFIVINSHAILISSRMLKSINEQRIRIEVVTQHLQESVPESNCPLQSPFNAEWQSFIVKQFRLAFSFLVICWICSIGEAIVVARHAEKPSNVDAIGGELDELSSVHARIETPRKFLDSE
ncbi:hypothetical protein [Aureliella helgolandensis]|uniref:Uncharacterized protein n=1 Tax=Aureliella helgolandensis TaxID=2527968 RepID=A0A518G2T8_9BACT|nr:hypothetical protein [Aureliella helgolandensis]QDV22908.1 hypothetical protein Q31a_12010 [Aureliella helgolandensis]